MRSHLAKPLLVVVAVALALAVMASAAGAALPPDTTFAVAMPNSQALAQIRSLAAGGSTVEASQLQQMVGTPTATWFVSGSPTDVQQGVAGVVKSAVAAGTVPIIVAYDIPGRDCAQYSAGGATSTSQYDAWIDGVAAGIGNATVVVLLEPDSLGLLPSDCGGPNSSYPYSDSDRYAQLSYAVTALEAKPNAQVYLDGTQSAWQPVGTIAQRLATAGVAKTEGFFLNVSNFEPTQDQVHYGTWISECLAFATDSEQGGWRLGQYSLCASQYYPATSTDTSTWYLSDEWYAANMGTAVATTHMVIDTSRNGQGPWTPPQGEPAGDPQVWCNPPDRGAGQRPTANTGVALVDAYLWGKTPGESDGGCYRWTAGPTDPVRLMVDPAAGAWFDQAALELATLANPAFPAVAYSMTTTTTCKGAVCITSGTAPAPSTSVSQSASMTASKSLPNGMTMRLRVIRGRCAFARAAGHRRPGTGRRFTCRVRLPKGRWMVATNALRGRSVLARSARRASFLP